MRARCGFARFGAFCGGNVFCESLPCGGGGAGNDNNLVGPLFLWLVASEEQTLSGLLSTPMYMSAGLLVMGLLWVLLLSFWGCPVWLVWWLGFDWVMTGLFWGFGCCLVGCW